MRLLFFTLLCTLLCVSAALADCRSTLDRADKYRDRISIYTDQEQWTKAQDFACRAAMQYQSAINICSGQKKKYAIQEEKWTLEYCEKSTEINSSNKEIERYKTAFWKAKHLEELASTLIRQRKWEKAAIEYTAAKRIFEQFTNSKSEKVRSLSTKHVARLAKLIADAKTRQ